MTSKRIAVGIVSLIALLAASAPAQTRFKFDPVVQAGDLAPVPPQLGSILEFSSNDHGDLAVIGDGGLFIKSGQGITVVVGPNDPAPGGGTFLSEEFPLINSQGQVFFRGSVTFPGTSGLFLFSGGHFTNLIPDGTVASNGVAVTPFPVAINASGDMVVSDVSDSALYLFSNGSLTPVVASGQPAPGGGAFSLFFGASINQADQIAFEGFLPTGGTGIYLYSGGTITKIIAPGDTFADGGVFAFADPPVINDAGQIAFAGISNFSAADGGVFLFSGGQLTVVVQRGIPVGAGTFLDPTLTVSLNNAGQIAVTGFITNFTSLIGTSVFLFSNDQLIALEVPGQTAPDGDTFTDSLEVGAEINTAGEVIFIGNETQRGNTLYRFSQGQLAQVVGQGDTIPRQPQFAFPIAVGIGGNDTVLISDSTFPGGSGAYRARSLHQASVAAHIGQQASADGVIDFLFQFAMNRENQVVLGANMSNIPVGTFGNEALLLNSSGGLTVLADRFSDVEPQSPVAINNLGDVAFGGFVPASGQQGLFLDSSGQITLLVDHATPLPTGGTLTTVENPSLNVQKQVAFLSEFSFPSPNAIYLSSAGQITALARDGDPAPGGGNFSIPFGNSRFGPVTNDNGQVAFATFLTGTTGPGGIFLLSQGVLTRIVGPGDPAPDGSTFFFADSPSINNNGQVAFFGETGFDFGAYMYSGGKIVKIAAAGDFAGKQQLGFVDMPQIDENGHVGFTANLLDGSNAIFVARPKGDDENDAESPAGSAPFSPEQMNQFKARNSWLLEQRQHRKKANQPNLQGHVIASH